jgi:hypothetical protein
MIAAALPRWAADDSVSLILCDETPVFVAAFLANLSSICIDFIVQRKITTFHIRKHVLAQLPIFTPSSYSPKDLRHISSHVLELVYTSHVMAPFANELGFYGAPFKPDRGRRATIRAELDAWYARAYGLTKDELRYVLDPSSVHGPGYPSETFRVLKDNECRLFGEFRTQRLILEAWDRMSADATATGTLWLARDLSGFRSL